MFSNYRSVFWLCAVMALFVYVPFYVNGFSTDVWTRLARISEWSALGFPWHEQLTTLQNYPFGQELHWTRPLDVIGYAFAWTFIPVWGMKKALEMMAIFVPFLVLLTGIRAYFYGMRGYVTPKVAFFGFWLFFYGIGYIWGQSSVGYFDHHVFHFSLLMWVVALTARSFIVRESAQVSLMALAGALTALGTWITAEFSINLIFVTIPYAFGWLLKNKSLKPLAVFGGVYTLVVLAGLSFDHQISGFWTLDMYRFSLFHALLGGLLVVACLMLTGLFRLIKTSVMRRLIYGVLVFLILASLLILCFAPVIIKPMTDPVVYHLWVKKVTEMAPLTDNWPNFFKTVILNAFVVLFMTVVLFKKHRQKRSLVLVLSLCGLVFYTIMMISHVRVGISVDVFFIWTMVLFLNEVFFPREKSFKLTLFFVSFYALFIATSFKGRDILNRFIQFGVEHYRTAYEKNENIELPKILKHAFLEEKAKNEDKEKKVNRDVNALFNHRKEDDSYACKIPENIFKRLREHPVSGGVLTDVFEAPQVLWETSRPVWGGPYHDIVSAHIDMTRVFFDDGHDFATAKQLMEKRKTRLLMMTHPKCMPYLFWNDELMKLRDGLDNSFYFKTYYELPGKPSWIKQVYYDEPSGVKIFEVVSEPQQPKTSDQDKKKKP